MSVEKVIKVAVQQIQTRFDKGLRVSQSFGSPQVMRLIAGTKTMELVSEPGNKPALLAWLDGYGAGQAAAKKESWDLLALLEPEPAGEDEAPLDFEVEEEEEEEDDLVDSDEASFAEETLPERNPKPAAPRKPAPPSSPKRPGAFNHV